MFGKRSAEKNKKERTRVEKTFADLWPGAYYDASDGMKMYFNTDGTVFDIIEIRAKDLANASDDEIAGDINRFTKAWRTVSDDVKIICMNYPCNTDRQMTYLRYKEASTRNDRFAEWLAVKADELDYLQKNTMSRKYYLKITSKDPEELDKDRIALFDALGQNVLVEAIPDDRKHDIVCRLNNKCITR